MNKEEENKIANNGKPGRVRSTANLPAELAVFIV